MNATDVLDAYLDQHCKRSFQSSKTVLCGKPPRHGERKKPNSSSPKRISAYGSLRKAAGYLSPASSPARRSNEANPAIPTDRKSTQISKQHNVIETPNPLHNTAQRSASVPLAGNGRQQQTATKLSASEPDKGAYRGWPNAEVKRRNSLPVLSGSGIPGSKLDFTERPRSITDLPQPSASPCQGEQAPLRSARHVAEPQPTAVAKSSSMSSGRPSLQRRSNSCTADVLGSLPPLKHRNSNSFRAQPPGNSATSTVTSLGSAWLSENARAAAAVPSCGKSNQENFQTPWAAAGCLSACDPHQTLLGDMTAGSTALWEPRFRQSSLSTPETALSKLKSQVGKQSVLPGRSTKGWPARDSLAHISMNLPEAPAFRHKHCVESTTSQQRHDSVSHHPVGDVLWLSHLPVSSADHVGPSVMTQSQGSQPRNTSSHNSVMVSLPESPRKKIVRAQSTSQLQHPSSTPWMTSRTDSVPRTDATAEVDAPCVQGRAPEATGLLVDASLVAGPPRLVPAAFSTLSGLHASYSSTTDADRQEADAGLSAKMSHRAGPSDNSVELPLRQSDFSRELHRLREQWQARGRDQSQTALAGQSAASPKGQSLQQLRQSLLTQQQSRPHSPNALDLPQNILLEQPSKRQDQGEEANSPSSRSCSPRCRIAKAFRSPPRQGRASQGSPAARSPSASPEHMRPTSKGRSNHLLGRYQGSTAYRAAAEEARIEEEDGQALVGSSEPNDEVQNRSSLVLRDEPQAITTVINGHDVSISDLLADVRRIKLAGDSLRAVYSRPATAASQGKAAARSPSQDTDSVTGMTVRAARHVEGRFKYTFQGSSASCSGSCSDYSSDDSTGSHRSAGQSAQSVIGSGTATEGPSVVSRALARGPETGAEAPPDQGPAGRRAAAKEATVLSRDNCGPSPSMPMDWGVTPTRHWGTPTRARGSPIKLLRADGTARSREALPARETPCCALLAARHMALSPRYESLPAGPQSPPTRHRSLPARHDLPSLRHNSLPTKHESPPARRESLPARYAAPPAQQLVSPARRTQLGFNRGAAGVKPWGSAGVQGAPLARQHATGKAAGGPGARACPPADWQDRLVGNPSGEPTQTGGRAVGCGEEVDQVWSRYLARVTEKQGLQAGDAASGTAVVSSSQASSVEAGGGRGSRARALRAALVSPSCPAQLCVTSGHSRAMDLSTRFLQLHSDDADKGIHLWDLASTQSAATCASSLTAPPSRTYSLPASLTAAGNRPSSLPATLRPIAISPASSPAPLNGVRNVCDSDSSCHSESESYSSNCTSCSMVSGSHHSHCLDSLPTHAQHTQHAGRLSLDAVPQQKQQSIADLSCESSLVNQLPDLSQDWSPAELGEAGAPTATAAEVSSWANTQESAAATARLTAQHIRQRYPHLFGPDCSTTSPQPASNAVVGSQSERRPSNGVNTAIGKIVSCQVSAPTGLSGPATGVCGSSISADSPAAGAASFDSAAEESATCSTAVLSQGRGSEVLRAGQAGTQQGLHVAALHESPLRLLLKESNAALVGAIQAGCLVMPDHKLDESAKTFWSLLAEAPSAVENKKATGQAGDSKAADLTGSQPLQSIATAEMPSTTAGMLSTTIGMPSATAGMPSGAAGMLRTTAEMASNTPEMPSFSAGLPSTTAETPSTTAAHAAAHQAFVSAESSTGYTHEHMHQQEQQQQEPQQEREQCNVNRTGQNKEACLPSDRSDGSPSSATHSAVLLCELTLAQTDTVDLYGHNDATAEGETSLAHSTASTAQSASPTAASSAVADQGFGFSAAADQADQDQIRQISAPAAQARDADRQLDLSLAQGVISSAWLEDDLRHSEVKSEEEEVAPDQAAPLAASTVEVNPKAATAETLPAIAEALQATAKALPATAEALPATAGGWITTATEAAAAAQADVLGEQ